MIARRTFLASASLLAQASDGSRIKVRPVPLSAVRLTPSIYADAVERNRRTLLELDSNRLLHNFHQSAGLPTKGARYGGWEARGIAGHTLGHYLSALSLMWAQTGDPAIAKRLASTVAELARIQQAHGDGYLGGTTVDRGGKVLDGKIVFEELRRGDVRSGGFDVNGGWVPLYTWHKVHAGLIDAERLGGILTARPVMLRMADYPAPRAWSPAPGLPGKACLLPWSPRRPAGLEPAGPRRPCRSPAAQERKRWRLNASCS